MVILKFNFSEYSKIEAILNNVIYKIYEYLFNYNTYYLKNLGENLIF